MLYHTNKSYFNTKSNSMNLSVKLFVQQFNKQEVNIKLLTILNTTLPGTTLLFHATNQTS